MPYKNSAGPTSMTEKGAGSEILVLRKGNCSIKFSLVAIWWDYYLHGVRGLVCFGLVQSFFFLPHYLCTLAARPKKKKKLEAPPGWYYCLEVHDACTIPHKDN